MVRYFYVWTPLVVIGALVLLSLPWLALIALMIAVTAMLAALTALTRAIVAAPVAAGRAIDHRFHRRSEARQPSPALSVAERRHA
jgi:uncharacterized protein (DUF58 family)